MLSSPRALHLAASLAVALGSAACATREAPPPAPAAPLKAAPAATARPAVPPGHLARSDVDLVLTTQGPPWVLRQVLSEEVLRSDGKFAGWRLVGLPESWSGIDLKPGDVVMRVNGLPLETPDEFWEAWKSVATASDLTISLTRDGAARQLVIPIDGAPSAQTAQVLRGDAAPLRPAPPPARSRTIGGAAEAGDEEAY